MEQQLEVLGRLVTLGKGTSEVRSHRAGIEYTSLMMCFRLHNLSAAETFLQLLGSLGEEWFPSTVAYSIARTMFEIDVTAHYISKNPSALSLKYINYGHVLDRQAMEACRRHRTSRKVSWKEAMELSWQERWQFREDKVEARFSEVASQFSEVRKGKTRLSQNWSGMSLRQMATEVDHVEAYEIFYAELSSFTHADVHLADRFLKRRPTGYVWSRRAREYDVFNVFRHASSFLTCFLEFFGSQFNTWTNDDVEKCWRVKQAE